MLNAQRLYCALLEFHKSQILASALVHTILNHLNKTQRGSNICPIKLEMAQFRPSKQWPKMDSPCIPQFVIILPQTFSHCFSESVVLAAFLSFWNLENKKDRSVNINDISASETKNRSISDAFLPLVVKSPVFKVLFGQHLQETWVFAQVLAWCLINTNIQHAVRSRMMSYSFWDLFEFPANAS